MSKLKLAVLSLAAMLILGLGIRFRPAEPQPTSESVAAELLPTAVSAGTADELGQFFAKRALELSHRVAFADSTGSTLRWNDTVQLATSSTIPVVVTRRAATGGAGDTIPGSRTTASSAWAMLIARNSSDSVIWVVVLQQGSLLSECAGRQREEIVLGSAPSRAFAGAGVFSPNGRLKGAVVNCGDRLAAITRASLDAWIEEPAASSTLDAVRDSAPSRTTRKRR